MSRQIIISVMSKDRPGLIADITGAVFALDGDLADLKQSVLSGYFSMILLALFDERVGAEDIRKKIQETADDKVKVWVQETESPADEIPASDDTYIVTAQGRNRSGLVHGISRFCCERGINILDLVTRLSDGKYTMIFQIELAKAASANRIRLELADFAKGENMKITMQHNDIFKATNEVSI